MILDNNVDVDGLRFIYRQPVQYMPEVQPKV